MGSLVADLKTGTQSSNDLMKRFKELRKLQADIDLADEEAERKEEHDKSARIRSESVNKADLGGQSVDHGQIAQDAIDNEFDLDAKIPKFNAAAFESEIQGLVKVIEDDCVPRALSENERQGDSIVSPGLSIKAKGRHLCSNFTTCK